MTEAEIRAIARRDLVREIRAMLNFWEPADREALATDAQRDIYDNEVELIVGKLERATRRRAIDA